MAKQSNQKLKLLYLLKILLEETNEQSGMTISQISAELAKYNVSAARKSLYDDIESLRVFGIDVQVKRDRYVRYYIAKRDISSVELKYVIDAIEQFDALVPSAGYELAQKIMRIHGMKQQVLLDNFSEPLYHTPKAVFDELTEITFDNGMAYTMPQSGNSCALGTIHYAVKSYCTATIHSCVDAGKSFHRFR